MGRKELTCNTDFIPKKNSGGGGGLVNRPFLDGLCHSEPLPTLTIRNISNLGQSEKNVIFLKNDVECARGANSLQAITFVRMVFSGCTLGNRCSISSGDR